MTNREQILKLRGKYIRKVVATVGELKIEVMGWENYPEPSFWEIIRGDKSISGMGDFDSILPEAYHSGELTLEEANALEIANDDAFHSGNYW